MRDDDKASSADGATDAPAKRTGPMVLAAVLAVSLLAGGAVGMTVVGPKFSAAPAAAGDHGESEDDGGGHGGGHGKHGKSESNLHSIESLVVNPAGTNGMRFLIVSVVVELDEPKTAESLKNRDAAVRDALLNLLGGKTVDQLSDVAMRDSLKAEISSAVAHVLPSGKVKRLFLPQFVLQ